MKKLEDGRVIVRCKIDGEFDGQSFTYEDPYNSDGSQYIWPNGDPSDYWWRSGNMACDCNLYAFLPEEMKKKHDGDCSHRILIRKITPLEGNLNDIYDINDYRWNQ